MAESVKTLADIPSTGSSDALVETRGGPTVSHDALAANADEIAAIVRRYEGLELHPRCFRMPWNSNAYLWMQLIHNS
jgi:hypothetical protein